MRRLFVLLLLLALPVTGYAADIDGHWGLSAPLFSTRGDTPYSLLYRFTNAWTGALDVNFSMNESLDDENSGRALVGPTGDAIAATVGPRVRRYLKPADDFSPYLDLFANGGYQRNEFPILGDRQIFRTWSVALGGGLGCEYFLPRWHCGVVVHTDLFTVTYADSRGSLDSAPDQVIVNRAIRATTGVAPALILRAYF